jgi:hypothetical protein
MFNQLLVSIYLKVYVYLLIFSFRASRSLARNSAERISPLGKDEMS